MSNEQLYLAIGVPVVMNLLGFTVLMFGLSSCFEGINKRFDTVDKRFDGLDKRFDDMRSVARRTTSR